MKYEIGWHDSSLRYCHVALINDAGERDDLFDVQLYDPEVIEDNGKSSRDNSEAALEKLVELANIGQALLKLHQGLDVIAHREFYDNTQS